METSGWWIRTTSEIWSPTRYTGVSAESGSWKTMEIVLPRRRESCLSFSSNILWPSISISPLMVAVRGSRPITARELTDLPEPDSPTMARASPLCTS